MRIDGQRPLSATMPEGKTNGAGKSHAGQGCGANALDASDHARFSLTDAVRTALTGVASQPELYRQKIEALRQAIGNGSYRVDANAIAEAMMRDLR